MVRQIDDLLRDLGWADGFHIPVANDENKSLEQKVENKIKEKGELTIQLEVLNDQVNSTIKYSQNVKHEQDQNQAILTAHTRQVETEENLYRSAQAEQESYERELKRVNKTFQELGERHCALQNSIFTHTEKLENLKANVKWDKDALLAWEEHVARGEENNLLLARYAIEDESRAKELELNRLRLCKEVDEKNRLLHEIIGDVDSLERVLQRTADLFKKTHSERQESIAQWENSVRILHQRDRDIHNLMQEIALIRAEERQKLETLREHKQFYENEVKNNNETDAQISVITRSLIQRRDDYNKCCKLVEEMTQELARVRRTLAATALRVENHRARNISLSKDIKAKKSRIIEMSAVVHNTQKRLDQVTENTTSAAERARHLEEMIQCEEKTVDIVIKDTERLNELLFRTQRELNNLKKQEEQQQIDIRCLESAKSQISSRIQQQGKELSRQKEIIYNKEFEAQMIEARINRLTGADLDYEVEEANEKKIAELEKTLSEKTATFNLLTGQNKKLEERMQGLTKTLARDAAELEKLVNKKEDQVLMTDGGQKQLEIKKAHLQESQVEENILRLRINQAEKAIAREGDMVYSLEKQKLDLESAMKEREVEIVVHKDVLLVHKRKLNEEKSSLISGIKANEIKIDQLQKKYDIVMSSLGQSEDGEPLSVTYFKIKSAQEKYELQQEGDELDAKIRKAEKEILAMENTLKVVNAANDTYRRNLSAVDEQSDEYKKKTELDSQYYSVIGTLKERKSQLNDLNKQAEILEQSLREITITEDELKAVWRNNDQEANDLEKDLRDQTDKLQRAEKQLRKTVRELKSMSQSKLTPLEEKDIALRELQEQNQSALQQLAELVARHIEAGPVVTRYLEEKGLSLPMSRSPGGTLTCVSSRECMRHAQSTKSQPSSRLSQSVLGSPSSSQLHVAHSTTSQETRSSSSSSSSRSGHSVPAASVITLDPNQLDGTDAGTSTRTVSGSATSMKSKQKSKK
ncbi:coiled-coil domain-containing protein 39 isoform X1 [Periplaneta americana]|uniref:coiled-coil domain-containing protein 39 isoform X1 n=1 Tax=Periplaneta americana TaxID=6978 RepID=UPI0037E7A763